MFGKLFGGIETAYFRSSLRCGDDNRVVARVEIRRKLKESDSA
jgi:hypothetical protein